MNDILQWAADSLDCASGQKGELKSFNPYRKDTFYVKLLIVRRETGNTRLRNSENDANAIYRHRAELTLRHLNQYFFITFLTVFTFI